jgi:hypothetical protein
VIAIASNEPFSGWTKTFTDPRLCAAIVGRLTFAGQIIKTGTTSYRLAHARQRHAMVATESTPRYLARRASPQTQSLPSRRIAQSQPSRRSRSSSRSGSTKFLITRNVLPSRSRRSMISSRPGT